MRNDGIAHVAQIGTHLAEAALLREHLLGVLVRRGGGRGLRVCGRRQGDRCAADRGHERPSVHDDLAFVDQGPKPAVPARRGGANDSLAPAGFQGPLGLRGPAQAGYMTAKVHCFKEGPPPSTRRTGMPQFPAERARTCAARPQAVAASGHADLLSGAPGSSSTRCPTDRGSRRPRCRSGPPAPA